MATLQTGNSASPMAICHYYIDASGNAQQAQAALPYPIQHSAGYATLTASGTTTQKAGAGVIYGVNVTTAGTASTVQLLDGTNALTAVTTNTTVGAVSLGFPSGVGIRFNTSLVVIYAGTAVSTSQVYFA